jgi:hypothetical protein
MTDEINKIDTPVMKSTEFHYISDGTFAWNQKHIHYANKWWLSVTVSESLHSGGKRA